MPERLERLERVHRAQVLVGSSLLLEPDTLEEVDLGQGLSLVAAGRMQCRVSVINIFC
jgi:hypothetical protein